MRVTLCLFLLMLSFNILQAQETVPDTVASEEEYQYIEDAPSTDEDAVSADEEEDETPSVIHESVSPEKLPTTQDHARSKMTIRKFDDAKWKKIAGSTSFDEKPDKPKGEDDKKDKGDGDEDEDPPIQNLPSVPWDSELLRVIAYVIVIGLIVAVVYFFTKDLRFSSKIKPGALPEQDLTASVENIEHIDVTSALQKAIAEGNFRLAVRMYFLDLLKKLNETGYIAWKKEKTNYEYLMELYSKGFYFDDVRKLTLAYELVWYGEHTLSDEAYQKLFSEFESINQNINTSAAA
jgi:hypothetical protein